MVRTLAIAAVAVVVGAMLLWHPPQRPAWSTPSAAPSPPGGRQWPDRSQRAQAEVVYVAGEVAHPGLYAVPPGARAADAVKRAGGFRADADTAGINLAERVADGAEIDVEAIGQRSARTRPSTQHRIRGSTHRRSRRSYPSHGDEAIDSPNADIQDAAAAVDVNAAGAQALAQVPGVGRAIAGRIVEMRERTGPFASLDELLDVAGMTQSRLERARPYLRGP
jgi:competence protein ComEA